jgi:hypothetical protein
VRADHGHQPIDRERLAQHGCRLEQRSLGGLERVEARGDQRLERLRHRHIGEIVDGPVDTVLEHELPVRHEHADDLDRVERDPLGARHDPPCRVGRQPRDQAGQELAHRSIRQRLEGQAGEVALAGAPVRPRVEELGPRQAEHVDRGVSAPLDQVVDEGQQPGVGPLQVLEDHDDRGLLGDALEERPPGPEELILAAGRGLADAQQGQQGDLDPAPLLLVACPGRHGLGDPLPSRGVVLPLHQAGAFANHLAERPEGDPAAVGGRSAVVPIDDVDEAVDVLEELPREPALADAALPGDRHQPDPAIPGGGVEEVLDQPELVVPPDKRRLERLGTVAPPHLGDDPQRSPGRHGGRLPLERLLAGLLEGDPARGGPHGRLAHQHGPRRCRRLEAAGGVDEVTGHHPLVERADRDRGLAGQDACASLDLRAQRVDGAEELEAGPDGALGIVLVARRGAPDRHHRVADELLHRPAVALDHLAGQVEVARQELADLLRVARLGKRGEADDVREEDRDEPSLGDGASSLGRPGLGDGAASGRSRRVAQPGAALAAELGRRWVGLAARWAGGRETRAALEAELPPGLVLGSTGGALHRRSRRRHMRATR